MLNKESESDFIVISVKMEIEPASYMICAFFFKTMSVDFDNDGLSLLNSFATRFRVEFLIYLALVIKKYIGLYLILL